MTQHIFEGGVAFLKRHVRRGILPKMLEEIIDTRLMVKRSMKLYNQEAKKKESKLLHLINFFIDTMQLNLTRKT